MEENQLFYKTNIIIAINQRLKLLINSILYLIYVKIIVVLSHAYSIISPLIHALMISYCSSSPNMLFFFPFCIGKNNFVCFNFMYEDNSCTIQKDWDESLYKHYVEQPFFLGIFFQVSYSFVLLFFFLFRQSEILKHCQLNKLYKIKYFHK